MSFAEIFTSNQKIGCKSYLHENNTSIQSGQFSVSAWRKLEELLSSIHNICFQANYEKI